MKGLITSLTGVIAVLGLSGCAVQGISETTDSTATQLPPMAAAACEGATDLPPQFVGAFVPAIDPSLLNQALGDPGKGGLCQGQVYITTGVATVKLYRAWNSTNPGSRTGSWWAFYKPAGKVAAYREDYEICYQWSPLDKLVTCDIKPGTKVVVGNGQSASCSAFLNYGVSASQQVYIPNAGTVTENCTDNDAVFAWQ